MSHILVGTCSWTDQTLIESGRFYPSWARSAEARLQYYASQFPIVEVDRSYYALLNERTNGLRTRITGKKFIFDIKAFRLFTQHPTPLSAFPRDIREALPEELKEWMPRVKELASKTRQLHVLFNNCYADKAVVNARQTKLMLD